MVYPLLPVYVEMSENVYVVVDRGDVSQRDSLVTVRGVYDDEDKAETRKEDIDGPFKSVDVVPSTYHEA